MTPLVAVVVVSIIIWAKDALTFTLLSAFIPQHIDLIDWAKLFKEGTKLRLTQILWDLSYEHFDSIWIRHISG